ncbi:dCTP deaminase [Facilibium subflavum]|uniref:dCTP deaminase n=1 Tax=Facilibium subflavum TaxID=2219058 RepID=UPI000E653681|nr:deoxycytidine deaminase [Facilibium subflavum]
MILTGDQIVKSVWEGDIYISPFDYTRVNPNSYNYLLGNKLKVYKGIGDDGQNIFEEIMLDDSGYVLQPGTMYLGVTHETIGSSRYAMSLIGRSSIGRYGLFLQISANLGHTTSSHRWTLELYACMPIRLYPMMPIGQVSFWNNLGEIRCMGKTYARFNDPQERFGR